MKMLYNELLKLEANKNYMVSLQTLLNKAQIFHIDNVAEYFYQSDHVVWDAEKDFPNMAPPFENFYFEYRLPMWGNFEEGILPMPGGGTRVGILCNAKEMPDNHPYKWTLTITVFDEIGELIRLMGFYFIGVDKTGQCMPLEQGKAKVLISLGVEVPEGYREMMKTTLTTLLYPALLAISFMHCKNVKTVPRGPGISSGKRNRRSPGIRFHVLEIEPMKEVLRTEGNSESVGLQRALHICRGHFKTFSGKGLFGKYTGTYFWNSHVRGSRENGIVLKDYQVNSPHKES
jgi:hypothetical protein